MEILNAILKQVNPEITISQSEQEEEEVISEQIAITEEEVEQLDSEIELLQ